MTQALGIKYGEKVLEIGTGSGYQSAVLAHLTPYVFTIEIREQLAEKAIRRLSRLGYKNIEVKIGDGYQGWKEKSPFDAIIITAAPDHVSPTASGPAKNRGAYRHAAEHFKVSSGTC